MSRVFIGKLNQHKKLHVDLQMPLQKRFEILFSWVRENGGKIDEDLYVDASNETNRVLRTKKAKKLREVLIEIPLKCTINSSEKDYEIRRRTVCYKFICELSKGPNSFFLPYLLTLPTIQDFKKMDYHLFTFDENDLTTLSKISPRFGQILKEEYYKEIELLYNIIKADLSLKSEFRTFEIARYSVAIFHTRGWRDFGLIPVVDLTNHINNPACGNSIVPTSNRISFSTPQILAQNDEITWYYNFLTPLQLYVTYGMNPGIFSTNFLHFFTDIKPDDKASELDLFKKKLASKNGLQKEGRINFLLTSHGIKDCDIFFPALRINQLSELDLEILKKNKKYICEETEELEPFSIKEGPLTLANEYRCLKLLLHILQTHEIKIPSDEAFLKELETCDSKFAPLVQALKIQKEIIDINRKDIEAHWLSFLRSEKTDPI